MSHSQSHPSVNRPKRGMPSTHNRSIHRSSIKSHSLTIRLKRELPPTAPMPALLQTLACRWIPLGYFEWCRKRYGGRFTTYPIDMTPVVFMSNPEDIHTIITAPPHILHPGAGVTVLTPLVGEGSFMLQDEDEHIRGRRTIMPPFHHRAVRNHGETIRSIVEREVESWPFDTAFPVHPHLRALTLRVVMRTVFGTVFGEAPPMRALHGAILDMLAVTEGFVLQQPRLRHLPGWRHTWRTFERQCLEVDRLIAAIVHARRTGAGITVLDGLLQAHNPDGSPLSDRQIRDHLMSVLLAGHETTAAELAWAFQLLAHNPRVQARLIEEIDADPDADPDPDVDADPGPDGNGGAGAGVGSGGHEYLTATVQEVLRHRPVFLFAIPRVVVEPIEIGGWTYRPPAQLLGCIYLMHHDPALYPDPHEFRPERFLGAAPSPRVWLPWGGGRKRCPGHHLATLEMQTVLRTVLSTRTVQPAAERMERACWRSVIVTPHAGSRIVLRRRGW